MGFPFIHVCELLESLHELHTKPKPLSEKDIKSKARDKIWSWFRSHREEINKADGVALLSALLPELRTDKVYGLKEKGLQTIIGKTQGLGPGSMKDLRRCMEAGRGDLGDCAERVLKPLDPDIRGRVDPKLGPVTLEEIEQATMTVASQNRFSSPLVKSFLGESPPAVNRNEVLARIYRRLESREAKWLTRLILKWYLPVEIPEYTVYQAYHPHLPYIFKVRAHFSDALELLRQFEQSGGSDLLQYLRPQIGARVGRPIFHQARSIHHCMVIGDGRPMVVERKYDGEYLQLHIDLSRPRRQWIQIFSKSGKDSTSDRKNVHDTIMHCLNLDKTTCKISEKCILEGELVVYSDKDKRILPFEKIRKHVDRSGSFIGADEDSQVHPFEHLCIMFFDIMLLDDQSFLNLKHSERQKHLRSILQVIPGRADIVQRETIDFSSPKAAEDLRRVFGKCILKKEEGLVVKPDEPYFNFSGEYNKYKSCCIKMKKDAMGNNGEVGDFAVVGANYNSTDANRFINLFPPVKWTEFCLGCLKNREEVSRFSTTPRYVIVKIISLKRTMMEDFMRNASRGEADEPRDFEIETPKGIANGKPPQTVFAKPFVFDITSFGFDREGNTGFYTVRFPYVRKIHYDRNFMDCLTFSELQDLAEESKAIPPDHVDTTQEIAWMKKNAEADPKNKGNLRDFVTKYEKVQRLTQAIGHATTQDSAVSNSSDSINESQVYRYHESIHAASSRVVTAAPTSISEIPTFRFAGLQTGSDAKTSRQAEELPFPVKSGNYSSQSHKMTQLKIRVSSSRNHEKGLRPPYPPAQFLEQDLLARAAEEYAELLSDAEDDIQNIEDCAATAQTEVQRAGVNNSAATLIRKRLLEQIEQSPESSAKRPRRTSTSSNSTSRISEPKTSSPRKVFSDITNSPPMLRRESLVQSSVAKPNVVAPYPTLPDEPTDMGTFPNFPSNENVSGRGSNYAGNTSSTKFVTPHRSPKIAASNYSSSSANQTPVNTPGSSPPSVHGLQDRALESSPKLFLPSSPSLVCISSSSTSTTPCHFARYTFFLSPCIAQTPYITSTLLLPHNRPFTTSLTQWADPSIFPTYFPSDHPIFPRKRILKCVLVEPRRPEATAKLILDLKEWAKEHDFRRSNGEKEPVVVVDWRILEKVKKIEEGIDSGDDTLVGKKLWKRFDMYGGFI